MTGQKSNISKCDKRKKVEKLQPRLLKEPCAFTQISNDTLNGIDDAEVLGVYCYLAGRPPEWIICKTQLRNYFKLGINKIDSIFAKLRRLGLLELVARKNEKGKIEGWDCYLKNHINIRTKTTPMDSMPMDSIPMENDPHINKDNKNKENKNIKEKIYKKENDSEFVEVIEKAQECLDKTKENLPSAKSEIIPYDYQETNLPVKPKKSPIKVLQAMNTLSLSDEFLNDLIATRKANGGKVSASALKSVYNELIKLKKAGFDLDECLSVYANCGWKGFVAEWCINAIEKKKKNPYDFYSSNDISWGEEMKNDPWYNGLLD